MRINLLKRLESSVHSFRLTIRHIKDYIDRTIEVINRYEQSGAAKLPEYETLNEELDIDDENTGAFMVGRLVPIDLATWIIKHSAPSFRKTPRRWNASSP